MKEFNDEEMDALAQHMERQDYRIEKLLGVLAAIRDNTLDKETRKIAMVGYETFKDAKDDDIEQTANHCGN